MSELKELFAELAKAKNHCWRWYAVERNLLID